MQTTCLQCVTLQVEGKEEPQKYDMIDIDVLKSCQLFYTNMNE